MWTGTIAFGIGAPALARRSISLGHDVGVQVPRPRLAVDEHDPGAAVADRVHRRDEGEVRHPDLVAGPDAGGDQRQVERRGPGDGGDGVVGADGGGQGGLERRQIGPEHEVAVPDGARRGLGLLLAHRRLGEPDPRIRHRPIVAPACDPSACHLTCDSAGGSRTSRRVEEAGGNRGWGDGLLSAKAGLEHRPHISVPKPTTPRSGDQAVPAG